MSLTRESFVSWWLPLIGFCLLAFFIQTHIYLHKDVAYLLHEAKLMYYGQTYGKGIFEPNPPLILFLSIPPIWLSKITGIDVLITMRFYVILLAAMSLSLSFYLIKKIFAENFLTYLVSFTVLYTLLFLPSHQFGQREHFLMILIYPYLFASGLFGLKQRIHPFLAVMIGLFAGIGFAIKPHFLPAFILIESYFVFKNKSVLGWLRTESIVVSLFLFLYVALIWFNFRSYLLDVYPLWWPYFFAIRHSLTTVLFYPSFIFSLTPFVFYFFLKKEDQYAPLSMILLLALVGLLISFLYAQVSWFYHIIPAVSLSCVILVILFGQFTLQSLRKLSGPSVKVFIGFLALSFFSFPILLSGSFTLRALAEFRKAPLEQLISFLKEHPNNNAFDFFTNTHDFIILEFYGKAHFVGRFPSFWWDFDLPILKYRPSDKARQYEEKYFSFFYDKVAEDLTRYQPRFVIVDVDSPKNILGTSLNYVNQLSQSKNFRIAWRHYRYFKTIDQYRIYARNL